MKVLFLCLLFCTQVLASEYKSDDQVLKEFKEPGHIPQGLNPSSYHKLEEVIPQDMVNQIKIKRKSKKRKRLEMAPLEQPTSPQMQSTPGVSSPVPTDRIDLRKYDSSIRNQWDGTCTAHGLIAGLENLYNRAKPTHLSTRYFWSLYQKYSAEKAIETASHFYQLDESYWPQDKRKPLIKEPSDKAQYQLGDFEYLEADVFKAVDAISKGYPVYVAMSVPQDLAACRATVRYNTGVTHGGHAMVMVGYQLSETIPGGGYFILKNSWGSDCGDSGYQYIPFALCEKENMYCLFWALKGVI